MDEARDGFGCPPKESGYWWFYTLLSDGSRLESDDRPSICYLDSSNEINIIGYDVALPYDRDKYELVKRIAYEI